MGSCDLSPKEYNPIPSYDRDRGRGKLYRFDLTEKSVANFVLQHEIADESATAFFAKALGGADALVSTEERLRTGIPVKTPEGYTTGKSPKDDMASGGAVRAFARLRRANEDAAIPNHLLFDADPLREVDALIYRDDKWGRDRVDSEFEKSQIALTPGNIAEKLGTVADNASYDETCLRDGVSFERLRRVQTRNAQDRENLLELLREKGITHFGKRKVEDVVK